MNGMAGNQPISFDISLPHETLYLLFCRLMQIPALLKRCTEDWTLRSRSEVSRHFNNPPPHTWKKTLRMWINHKIHLLSFKSTKNCGSYCKFSSLPLFEVSEPCCVFFGRFCNKISKIFKPNHFREFVLNGVSPSSMHLSSRCSMANVFTLVESNAVKAINQWACSFHFGYGNSVSGWSKIVETMYRRLNFIIAFWSFRAF